MATEAKTSSPKTNLRQKFKTLIYPSNLGREIWFPEAIKFTVLKREGTSIKRAIEFTVAGAKKELGVKEISVTALAESGGNIIGGIVGGLKGLVHSRQKETKSPIGSIYMFMPKELTFTDSADWGGAEMGAVGSGIAGMMNKGGGGAGGKLAGAIAGSAGNIGMAGVGSMITKVLGSGGMLGGILGAVGGGAIQKGIEFGTKQKSNPYMEMVFTGIGFRDFSFTFKFMPVSAEEVVDVIEIIKMFRLHSKPSYVGEGVGTLGKSYFNYPMYFFIEFLTLASNAGKKLSDVSKDKEGEYYVTNKYLPTIKTCVCNSVATNFTAAGMWAAFESGKSVTTELSLSFKETELVMAEDVYNPSRGEF